MFRVRLDRTPRRCRPKPKSNSSAPSTKPKARSRNSNRALRNREQRINTLQAEAQTLRDRLTQVESASAAKDTEIVKRDREIRLARSELQIVKDGSVGLEINPELIDGEQGEATAAPAGSDPKVAAEMKRLEVALRVAEDAA